MEPSKIILLVQWALVVLVFLVFLLVAIARDKGANSKRFFQIIPAAASAGILPVGVVFVWAGIDIGAIKWLGAGGYQISFLVIGLGVIFYALDNVIKNWPK